MKNLKTKDKINRKFSTQVVNVRSDRRRSGERGRNQREREEEREKERDREKERGRERDRESTPTTA